MQKFNWISKLKLYPLVLGALIGLGLAIEAQGNILIEGIIVLCFQLAFCALLLNVLLYALIRDADRSALLSSFVFFWIFSFGTFANLVEGVIPALSVSRIDEIYYLIPYSLIGLLIVWFCLKADLDNISKNLSQVVTFLFLFAVVCELVLYVPMEIKASRTVGVNHAIADQLILKADEKPDIYYIILDATASASTLENLFGIKNIELLDYLRKQGFYIADESHSNYDRTMLSLSSSLNFGYINYLKNILPTAHTDGIVPFRLMQDSQLAHCLKKLGYKTVNVASGFTPTEFNPYADVNILTGVDNEIYVALIYGMTIQRALEKYNHFLGDLVRAKKSWAFSHIEQVECIKGPKFVLIHILLPHPPFVFGEDGAKLPLNRGLDTERYTVAKYRGQVNFAMSQVQKMIDSIIKTSDKPPIIVLQGDHGSALDWQYPYSNDYLKQRLSILNAYLLPNHQSSGLYKSITPVNSFRVILNQYFQANLPLLPDVSYSAPPELNSPADFYKQFKPWLNSDVKTASSERTKAQ